jgi:hypothetical protein
MTIGSVRRETVFSFTPTVIIRDVRVPQPGWAGKGDLITIDRGAFRFNAFQALFGTFRPRTIVVTGRPIRRDQSCSRFGLSKPNGKAPTISSRMITTAATEIAVQRHRRSARRSRGATR